MNVKSFGSYDLADMARAFPDFAECGETSESIFYDSKRYASIICYGRLIARLNKLEVITRYDVVFENDDTHYHWYFSAKENAISFIEECYKEDRGD